MSSENPTCNRCGQTMVLIEKDTMLGDKYGCKNRSCTAYVEDDPAAETNSETEGFDNE